MPTRLSLAEAHAELEIEDCASLDQVRAQFRKLSLRYHPDKNQNSEESTAKFQRISASYDRIVQHHERPEPEYPQAFGRGGGEAGGMPGFDYGMPGFFFGFGGMPFGGFGGGDGWYPDFSDNDEYYTDEDEEDFSEDDDYDDFARFMFEDILNGGYGARRSYASYRSHTHHPFTAADEPPETEEERAERMKAEAEQIKKAEERRKNEARREKETEEGMKSATARRSEKKASKVAASVAAASLATKRLAASQRKRSAVFAAARQNDAKAVKTGVYEDHVAATGGEWLIGGKEAVEAAANEPKEDEKEKHVPLTKNQRKKANRKAARAAADAAADEFDEILASSTPRSPASPVQTRKSNDSGSPSLAQKTPLKPAPNAGRSKKAQGKKGGAAPAQMPGSPPSSVKNTASTPLKSVDRSSTPPKAASKPEPNEEAQPASPMDPKETLLHIAAKNGDAELVEWLVNHGATTDERDSSHYTALHLALLLKHAPVVSYLLIETPPVFPAPSLSPSSSASPDSSYPLPKGHSLLSLALAGGQKDPSTAFETAKLVLPSVGGREIRSAWRKAEFEQGKKKAKEEERAVWEELKWCMAERMKELAFEGFQPPADYLRRRRVR
ncbi:hypothetical protein JCM1840_006353 [Sporobolomyces johnsonii]